MKNIFLVFIIITAIYIFLNHKPKQIEAPTPETTQQETKKLPKAVEEKIEAIKSAAATKDYQLLAKEINQESFSFSFGGETDPVEYWQSYTPDIFTTIYNLLSSDYSVKETNEGLLYTWPAISDYHPSEWTPELLKNTHPDLITNLEDFENFGGYIGYRLGITDKGEWTFLIAGD